MILETMQMVTFSLISLSANVKDPFWKTSARNMLCGLMIYHFKLGKNNLVDIMDAILGQSIKTSIQEVMTGSDPDIGGNIAIWSSSLIWLMRL